MRKMATFAVAMKALDQKIIDKYNVPVPRYTSYPPANYFTEYNEDGYKRAISQSNSALDNNISFYIHFPYCPRLCHYCACNSYSMPAGDASSKYIATLHKELDMIVPMISRGRKVSQIHYGGGTPTAMPTSAIKELNDHIFSNFETIDRPEVAIECHPGYLGETQWHELADAGFTRMSIGVQDMNLEVLKTVNRKPSLMPLGEVFDILRSRKIRINLDFLYGLPKQTPESFLATIENAIALGPDRLVTFSYAHVPWLKKAQTLLEKAGLPSPETKEQMFETAAQALANAGYVRVGMDHFVKPTDELYEALQCHKLHRNFQGYCTRRTTAQVYALGVTGISQLETAYIQNTKDIAEYIATVDDGKSPVKKGHTLTADEQHTRGIIEQLMCNYHVELPHVDYEKYKSKLLEMEADGIVKIDGDTIIMTQEGTPFVRNVAAALDPLMANSKKSFSKPI